jgi:uncharacterized membrane protein
MTIQVLDVRTVGLDALERILLRELGAQRRAESLRLYRQHFLDAKEAVEAEHENKENS